MINVRQPTLSTNQRIRWQEQVRVALKIAGQTPPQDRKALGVSKRLPFWKASSEASLLPRSQATATAIQI